MMKKVINTLYSGLGGHGKVVFSLLETDFLNQYEHHLVFYGVEEVVPEYITKCRDLKIEYSSIIKQPKQYLSPLLQFYKQLKIIQPHVIIVHSSELVVPAVWYRRFHPSTKVVYVEHEPNHSKTFFENQLSKYSLNNADAVVCLNEVYLNELKQKYKVKSKTMVIPNGIAVQQIKTEINLELIFGMAARLVDTKDHLVLVEAFALFLKKHPEAQLKIAGSGDKEKEIKMKVKTLGIEASVEFLGLLDEEQMTDFFHSISFYVHATKAETLSMSLLQAMAQGLPIITSDITNNKALLTHQVDGLLYHNESVEDLYKNIEWMWAHPDQANQMALKAFEKVRSEYSIDSTVAKYKHLIDNL